MKIFITLNLEPLAVPSEPSATCVRAYHPALGIGTLDTIAVWWNVKCESEKGAIAWASYEIDKAQSAAQAVVDQWIVGELA